MTVSDATRRLISENHADVSGDRNPRYVQAPPKNELIQLYVVEKMPKYKVAAIYGVWSGVMDRWLLEYGIPNRGISAAHHHVGGENNPNWKGGITAWSRAFHNSSAHKQWRATVFERDAFTCQMCLDDTGGNIQAHHIEPIRDHRNDLSPFDINNGITLCKDCHSSVNNREYDFVDYFRSIIEGDNNV